jgi:hypothetical protein
VKPAGISGIKRGKIDELGTHSKRKNIRDVYKGKMAIALQIPPTM